MLTKVISCECKCKFNGRKCNPDQKWNSDQCRSECRKHHFCEKEHIWNLATCSCENGKYLASTSDDSVIPCDEIKEETRAVPINISEKNITYKTQYFYILLALLLITIIALLIAVSIYRYLIKYQANQKRLLPFYSTNNELKKFCVNNIL